MVETLGEGAPSYSMVKKWAAEFKRGRENGGIYMKLSTKHLTILSVLIAMEIILSRFFSVTFWSVSKLSFAFIPLYMAGTYLGPKYAFLAGGIADLLGAILFPIMAYFPGFLHPLIYLVVGKNIVLQKKI